MLDQNTIENAQSCISQVVDVEALVAAFFGKLFATHPEVRGMFADDMSAQIVSLSNILKLAFSKLDSVGDLGGTVEITWRETCRVWCCCGSLWYCCNNIDRNDQG